MKHNPIALGFAALSAMTVMTACNVDSGRLDKNVDERIMKTKCASVNAVNTDAVYANRVEKLNNIDSAQQRTLSITPGNLNTFGHLPLYLNEDAQDQEKKEHALALKTESIRLDLSGCQDDLSAVIEAPGLGSVVGKVQKVETHKLTMKDSMGTVYVLETNGIKENMSEINKEDGFNQIKLTKTDVDGATQIIISESVEHAGSIQKLSPSDFKLMMNRTNISPASMKTMNYATAGGSIPLEQVEGDISLSVEQMQVELKQSKEKK